MLSQSFEVGKLDEARFYSASEELFQIFFDSEKSNNEKLTSILELGLFYYQLDTAVVSAVTGQSCQICTLVSNVNVPFDEGDAFDLNDTPAITYFGKESFNFFNLQKTNGVHYGSGQLQVPVLSYISSIVETANGPYGCVCFSSASARANEYNALDERLLLQIASWLGYLLGTTEQLEFVSDQNEHYKTLFASVPAMVFLCDADGLIISSSDQFAGEIGLAVEDVPGNICAGYFCDNDKKQIRQSILDGRAVCVPAKLLRPGKEDLDIELSVNIKPIGAMRNIRMVVAADVSARNAAFRVVTEQNRLLELANESLNQFAYVASHDLQEPLRKIQLFSNFLEEDLAGTLSEESKQHLDVVVSASQRMSALIEDLLEYSRASSTDPTMAKVDLNVLVNSVLGDLELLVLDSNASIEVSELPEVIGNEPLLRQLFTNLLGNAIKYRDVARGPIVRVFTEEEDGQRKILVADNGIGFDDEYATKIFEPFRRLHTKEHYKGTGIGLAICATVCEKHGWSIEAARGQRVGSVFVISID